MKLFVIVGITNSRMDLKPAIEKCYSTENRVNLGDANWLVADEDAKTPESVFKKISAGNPEGPWPTSFIVPVEHYYGVQNSKIWEWLTEKGF